MDVPRFDPKRRHSTARRALFGVLGSLLWVAAFVLVAVVTRRADAIELALVITAASVLMWTVLLAAGLIRRRRRERDPWPPPA